MIQTSEIREHLEVIGSDGGHVGKVDKIALRSRWTEIYGAQ